MMNGEGPRTFAELKRVMPHQEAFVDVAPLDKTGWAFWDAMRGGDRCVSNEKFADKLCEWYEREKKERWPKRFVRQIVDEVADLRPPAEQISRGEFESFLNMWGPLEDCLGVITRSIFDKNGNLHPYWAGRFGKQHRFRRIGDYILRFATNRKHLAASWKKVKAGTLVIKHVAIWRCPRGFYWVPQTNGPYIGFFDNLRDLVRDFDHTLRNPGCTEVWYKHNFEKPWYRPDPPPAPKPKAPDAGVSMYMLVSPGKLDESKANRARRQAEIMRAAKTYMQQHKLTDSKCYPWGTAVSPKCEGGWFRAMLPSRALGIKSLPRLDNGFSDKQFFDDKKIVDAMRSSEALVADSRAAAAPAAETEDAKGDPSESEADGARSQAGPGNPYAPGDVLAPGGAPSFAPMPRVQRPQSDTSYLSRRTKPNIAKLRAVSSVSCRNVFSLASDAGDAAKDPSLAPLTEAKGESSGAGNYKNLPIASVRPNGRRNSCSAISRVASRAKDDNDEKGIYRLMPKDFDKPVAAAQLSGSGARVVRENEDNSEAGIYRLMPKSFDKPVDKPRPNGGTWTAMRYGGASLESSLPAARTPASALDDNSGIYMSLPPTLPKLNKAKSLTFGSLERKTFSRKRYAYEPFVLDKWTPVEDAGGGAAAAPPEGGEQSQNLAAYTAGPADAYSGVSLNAMES